MSRLFYDNYNSQGRPYWYQNNYGYGYGNIDNIAPASEQQGYVFFGVGVLLFLIFIAIIVYFMTRKSSDSQI